MQQLINELETVIAGHPEREAEIRLIIDHAKTQGYPRAALIQELVDHKLKWFANKLASNKYDEDEG